MKLLILALLVTFTLSSTANATPGDAAYRAGEYKAAAKLYKKGAEQGDSVAAYKLAELHLYWKEYTEAIVWYKKSIELGKEDEYGKIINAYGIGEAYLGLADYEKAKTWYEKSASKGHHYSMYQLGGVYSVKRTSPEDDITGLMWIDVVTKMASTFDNPNEGHLWVLKDKKGYRKKLINRMSKREIEIANQKAEERLSNWSSKK